MLESDLYVILEKHFKALGYEVKGEVCGCDLVAIKGDEMIIVELKKSFTTKLLYQAVRRLAATDTVYVAFFKPQARQAMSFWTMVKSLCRRLQIGAIVVDGVSGVKYLAHPGKFASKKSKTAREKILKEFTGRHVSKNTGGVTGKKLETAYLESAVKIAVALAGLGNDGALSAKELRELGTSEKTHAILYQNHYGWFEKKDKGIYRLKAGAVEVIRKTHPRIWRYYQKTK